jgi:hypothetical protein
MIDCPIRDYNFESSPSFKYFMMFALLIFNIYGICEKVSLLFLIF